MTRLTHPIHPLALALAVLVTSALLAPTAHAQRQRGKPPATSQPPVASFADLRPGQTATTTLRITNTSDAPLTIDRVRTTCRCAVVAMDERTIDAGGSVEVEVSLEAPPTIGPIAQHAAIMFKGYAVPLQVSLTADVSKGVRVTRAYDPPGQGLDASVTLESTDGTPFRVLAIDGKPPRTPDGAPLPATPAQRHVVQQSIPRADDGMTPRWIVIETDHPTSPIIDIAIDDPHRPEYRSMAPWRLATDRVSLDTIHAGEVAAFEVRLRGEVGDTLGDVEWIESEGHATIQLLGLRYDEPTRSLIARLGVRADAPRQLLSQPVAITIAGHTESFHVLARVTGAPEPADDPPADDDEDAP